MSLIVNTLESIPTSDWYTSLIAIAIISFFLLLVEIGLKYLRIPALYTRKFIHIATGLIICVVAYFLYSNIPLIIFATSYIFIDLWALKRGKFKSIHPDSHSFGTLYYAISVLILSILFWNEYKALFIITNLIMIIPDAMAAIIGENYSKRHFIPVSEKKSLLGSFTMFILAVLIVFLSLEFFFESAISKHLIISLVVASVATVAELISFRGSDNLSIPLVGGLFLYVLIYGSTGELFQMIILGTVLAAIVSIISYKLRFLDAGGSALAFLMGAVIFGFGGWVYTFPILAFFIFSSILSKIGKKRKKQYEASYQKTSVRDFYQALSNGGVATAVVLIAFFTEMELFYYVYVTSLAAANADTWATELGIFSKSKPVLITNLKTVEPGTSGGISLIGTSSSLLGSFIIVYISKLVSNFEIQHLIVLTIAGLMGSLIDSLMGATVQGQYKCNICEKQTESKIHCQSNTNIIKGTPWIDNDLVNIFSIFSASLISFIIYIG